MKDEVRYICTWLLANILIILGFAHRAKVKTLRGNHILSIYFHKPSAKEFEGCIKWLIKNKFVFLSVDDLYAIIREQLPFPKGAVLLTADDGWQTNINNVVRVAEKHQVPITIFLTTDPVEHGTYWWSYVEEANKRRIAEVSVEQLKKIPNEKRIALVNALRKEINLPREAMTIEEVKKIAKSSIITIGGHTLSHPILNNCHSTQVLDELQESKEKLEYWTGKCIEYFAFPNGDYTQREISLLQKNNYKLAFTVRPEYLSPSHLSRRFELPRFEVIEGASFAETICRMVGVWEPLMQRLKKLLIGKNKEKQSFTSPNTAEKQLTQFPN